MQLTMMRLVLTCSVHHLTELVRLDGGDIAVRAAAGQELRAVTVQHVRYQTDGLVCLIERLPYRAQNGCPDAGRAPGGTRGSRGAARTRVTHRL